MKRGAFPFSILFLLMLLLSACTKGPGKKSPDQGGDDRQSVIAYCFQPSQNGVHQIYTIHLDGTDNQKVIDAPIGLNHHDCSPDGTKFAAVGYTGENFSTWSIHIFNSDGTGLERLTAEEGVWDSEPAWSPDGNRISFTRTYPQQNHRGELWMMNADGSDQHSIGVEGFAAKWSPDGTRIIYTSRRTERFEIYTCKVDGTNEQQLTDTEADEMFPMYSPDGSRVVFAAFSGKNSAADNIKTFEIYVMNPDGTGVRQLTDNDCFDSNPRWSPDGSRIVFSSDRNEENKWEVYVMDADGTNILRVTNSPPGITAINPVWKLD